jgi:hypothetical protein
MGWASGPFAIVTAVLVVGGVFKVHAPHPARETLAALGVPAPGVVARLSGPAEIALGAGAFLAGSRPFAAAVAAAFVVFTAVIGVQLRRPGGATASCGCFGRLSARPSALHLAANAVLALVAAGAAVGDVPAPLALVRSAGPGEGLVTVGVVALATWLTVSVVTVLPATLAVARRGPAEQAVRLFDIRPAAARAPIRGTTT